MTEQPAPADLPLLALLHRASRSFSDALLERLARSGVDAITPAHTTVLTHLGQAGEQPTISELARRGGVTRQTMHRAVTQLVEEGLVVTAPGPGFPRSTLVALTPEGARRRGVASAILDDLELELAAHLGEEAVAALRQTLTTPWPWRSVGGVS